MRRSLVTVAAVAAWLVSVVFTVLLAAAIIPGSGTGRPSGSTLVVVVVVGAAVMLVVHEAGHAVVARAVGYEVPTIDLGLGPTLFTIRAPGTVVRVKPLFVTGRTWCTRRGVRRTRIRDAAVHAAGVVANISALVIVLVLGPSGREWRAALTAVVVVMLFGNLLPGRFFGKDNDGLALWKVAIGRWPPTRTLSHEDLLDEGRLEAARVTAQRLVGHRSGAERAHYQNELAWIDLLSDREELLPEAAAAAAAAAKVSPSPAVLHTLGWVLIEIGKPDQGLPLVEAALDAELRPAQRAQVLATLAIGSARVGEPERARQALEDARAVDPDCILLERAARAVNR